MKFSKITFTRAIFIPGATPRGEMQANDVEADFMDEGLGFHAGPSMTIVPWVHILTATFEALAVQQPANLQPPPPTKNKRR